MSKEFINPLNADYNDEQPTLDELIKFLLTPPIDDPNYMKKVKEYQKKMYPDMKEEDFEDSDNIDSIYQEIEFTADNVYSAIVFYKKMQTLLDTKKEDRPEELDKMANALIPEQFQNTLNVFEEILGTGWGKNLETVLTAGPGSPVSMMDSYVFLANLEDSNLTEEQKQLVKDLRDVTAEAFCVNGPPVRLMKVLDDTSLEYIAKIYNNPIRLGRVVENIDFIIKRLKIYRLMAQYIPIFFSGMLMSYKWKYVHNYLANKIILKPFGDEIARGIKKHKRKNEKLQKVKKMHSVGIVLGILLAKYSQSIDAKDYASQWFVVMFLKFLSVNSFVSSRTKGFDDNLVTAAKNFFEYVDLIVDKYFVVGEIPDDMKQLNTVPENDEIDTTVPTKEQWEAMKKTPEEWEKEAHDNMIKTQQEYEEKKLQEETNSDTTTLPSIAKNDLVTLKGNPDNGDEFMLIEHDLY